MSNETNLDWLARKVHVWVPGELLRMKPCDNGNGTFRASWCYSDEGGFTKDQWLARRTELQNKPSWGDAPEWAEWLAQHGTGLWCFGSGEAKQSSNDIWYSPALGKVQSSGVVGEILGDWRDTLEKRPEQDEFETFTSIEDNQEQDITKQQEIKQDNGWYERGELPPVGVRCEALITSERQWVEIEVVCHRDGFALGWCQKERCGFHGDEPTDFRPLRTERDVAINAMKESCPYPGSWQSTYREFAEALYDAGYRKESK